MTTATPRITATTTLDELRLLRLQYGVRRMWIDYNGDMPTPVRAQLDSGRYFIIGTGADEIEALDDAFARLVHRIAELLPQQVGGEERCVP